MEQMIFRHFELENGFGPVKQKIELRPIDPKLVKQGQAIFETKCACLP